MTVDGFEMMRLSLWECLCEITDPRRAAGRRFSLASILSLLIAGTLCGKLSIRAIARWGKLLSPEQLELIGITRGVSPGQTTIHTLLVRLDPDDIEAALAKWVRSFSDNSSLHIAIDGKSLKASATAEYPALHLLSAFCSSFSGVLYQSSVSEKHNEISGAYDLLEKIPIKGNVISGDAIFCQKGLCSRIVGNDGDFIFVVKGNQKVLFSGIQKIFSPGA